MPTYKKYATTKKVISQTNFDALDKSTLAIGEEYDIVAPIKKTDLDTSLQGSVDKAENALPKPTNDSSGTSGQILKKTLSGSEWADASGGVTVIEKSGTLPNASTNLISISFTADEITTITNSFDTVVIKVTTSSQTLELHPFNKTSATWVFASVSAGTAYYNLSIKGTTGMFSYYAPSAKKYEHRICSLITMDDGATLQVLTTIITKDSTAYTSLASLPNSVKTRLQNGYLCIVSASDDKDSYRSTAVVYLSGNNVKIEGIIARSPAAYDIFTSSRGMTTDVGIDYDTVTEI